MSKSCSQSFPGRNYAQRDSETHLNRLTAIDGNSAGRYHIFFFDHAIQPKQFYLSEPFHCSRGSHPCMGNVASAFLGILFIFLHSFPTFPFGASALPFPRVSPVGLLPKLGFQNTDDPNSEVKCRSRLGGILNYDYREAA